MTEHERSDLRKAIEMAIEELRETELRILGHALEDSDADFNFLIQKARTLKNAIEGFQKQLKEAHENDQ